jgi:Cupin-like domain
LITDIDYTSVKLLTTVGDTKHDPDQPLLFSYFDRAAAWADERLESTRGSEPQHSSLPRYRSTSSLEEVVGFPFSDSEVGDEFVCDGEPYCPLSRSRSHVRPRPWHITQPLTPLQASKLAPVFPALLGGLASQAAFRLWLGRENVSVAPHYDIEDNWYMQLHGQKTFLLTSAEGFRFFRPHSVLHPSWRQAQRDYLRNVRSLEQAIHEVMVSRDYESADSLARSSGGGDGGGGGESTSPVAPGTTIPSGGGWSAPPVRIWSVTLHPGDLLFLPAFTFHTVTTGRDSASLSAWVPSAASTLYQDMRRMVPLPGIDVEQDLPEGTEVRLAQLGIAVQAVLNDRFVRGGYTQTYIKRLWSSRHRKSASERAWCAVPGPKDAGQCTPQSIAVADSKDSRLKTLLISQTLMAVLQSAVSSRELYHPAGEGLVVDQAAVRLLLVLDWAEEAIHELLQPVARSSPCAVMRFIETCVKWN